MKLNTNKITDLLKERGISVRKLSQVVELSQSGLDYALKSGTLRADVLASIAEFLQVPIEEFFEGNKQKSTMSSLYLEQRVELLEDRMDKVEKLLGNG